MFTTGTHRYEWSGSVWVLSEDQESSPVTEIESGRSRIAGELVDWIEPKYGVSLKENGMYSII